MTNTSIIVDADSLSFRPRGSATGNIWLVIGGCEFPALQWNDFVVVILGWWVESLLRLLRNSSTKETVNFMDGPYVVEVSRTPSGGLHLRALEGSNRSIERASGEALIDDSVSHLLQYRCIRLIEAFRIQPCKP